MDEKEWEAFLLKLNLGVRPNQYLFYKRMLDFILNPKEEILINQGGMGLGKTIATGAVIKETKDVGLYDGIYIATPTAAIKNEWSKELQKLNLFNNGVVWLGKSDCCIKKRANKNFNIDNCKDDCEFCHHLRANKVPTKLCIERLSWIQDHYPFDIDDYYAKFPKDCLLPITRYGLEQEKIIVGDYFGFLNMKMFEVLVGIPTALSILEIDEAHLIPTRTFEYLSKSLSLELTVRKMREELTNDYLMRQFFLQTQLMNCLDIISTIHKNIILKVKSSSPGDEEGEGRYTYQNFLDDYNLFKKREDMQFDLFIFELRRIASELYGDRPYEKTEDPYVIKFIRFFDYWKDKYTDIRYAQHFQYYKYKKKRKNEDIILKLVCRDTSEYLSGIWKRWKKVNLISGTIPDQQYFYDMLGLKDFNVNWQLPLLSYSIRDDVIIYAKDNFTSGVRKTTYDNNNEFLQEILKIMGGRTIIYIQSMKDAPYLVSLLESGGLEVINFCQYEDEDNGGELESVDKNKFELLKKEFMTKKEVVAIMGINGRVEGQNIVDEDKKPVDNIIIYGYPFPRQDLSWKDLLRYWKTKLNNSQKAKEYVTFRPVASKIYQAVMRAKRDASHKPNIILWGDTFSKGSPGYKYSYDELKGELIFEKEDLRNLLIKRKNDKNNIQ